MHVQLGLCRTYSETTLLVFPQCGSYFTIFLVSFNLGLKICGGCSLDGEELYGIFVKRVLPGGLADQDGKLIFVDLDKV